MKKKSVYLYGYYGNGNFGDDLLLDIILKKLQKYSYAEKYYIKNNNHINFIDTSSSVIQTNIEKHITNKKSIFSKMLGFYNYCFKHYKILKESHSIILGGGTLLNAHKSNKTLILLTIIITLAKVLKVKVYGLGIGIGKIESRVSQKLLKYLLESFDFLGVRDQKSFDIARKFSSNINIELTSDLSYSALDNFNNDKTISKNNTIGFSLVSAFINKTKENEFYEKIVKVIKKFQKKGYKIKFLSFQEGSYSDSVLFENIIQEYSLEDISLEYLSIEDADINEKFKSLEVFIGMRYHGLILSSLNNVPFIGFSTDHKIFELCSYYKMPYSKMEDISLDWLEPSIKESIKRKPDEDVRKKLYNLSQKNWRFLD